LWCFNPHSALENTNAELTKKLLFVQFLSGLTSYESYTTIGVVRPDKIFDFRQPKGQNKQ
jgi:hypothetical protein